ncbi:hypothetical protein [Brevundimonas subvibrioides]|uniref:Lipoprotein n=1 Tax=Brevundimonas subvibrioides (strain ATCC 15264 / DSM 4735 / LMG 14903 / NBRC 16000 / CB 81) TaxID=633149 RepID=D9QGU9_BRESC|nr:hypothetical protein [Brevundimonas subvibrioides]ADL00915.1 conserved hypothetical protein [Brevundimonas subvibrioides ATCC 15264]
MPRLVPALSAVAALAVSACGDVDVGAAGRNAAMAALEASHPEIVQGVEAARLLKLAAATCGWEDVDATRLAQTAVAGIEEPPLRAAASSLVEDLIVAPAATPAAGATTTASDCSPEVRQALEARIAAIGQGNGEAEAEAEAEAG